MNLMKQKKDIRQIAEEKFIYNIRAEDKVGKRGIHRGLIEWLCTRKYKGFFDLEYADYLSELGEHDIPIQIYTQYSKEDCVEKEYLAIAKETPEKEGEYIDYLEKKGEWDKLSNYYSETGRSDLSAIISVKKFKNKPDERKHLLAHAQGLCEKGDHLQAMSVYRKLGKYIEEANEWDCLGKPGTAIETLIEYEYLNEEKCKKAEAEYWRRVGLLSNAADCLEKYDNLRAKGLRLSEENIERKIDDIILKRIEDRIKKMDISEEEKGRMRDTMQVNGEVYKERIKIYQEKNPVWKVKIVECVLRLGKKAEAKQMIEDLGFKPKVLSDYIKKYKEHGKRTLDIKIELDYYGV